MLSQNEGTAPILESIKIFISLAATCLGLAVIVIGLKYATDIFQLIFTILKTPSYLTGPIQQMAESIGGSAFDLRLEGRSVPLANIMALMVYCCGALLSAWLTLALMHTGAKIVALTAGDKNAIRKILQNAFGNNLQPKSETENSRNRSSSRS